MPTSTKLFTYTRTLTSLCSMFPVYYNGLHMVFLGGNGVTDIDIASATKYETSETIAGTLSDWFPTYKISYKNGVITFVILTSNGGNLILRRVDYNIASRTVSVSDLTTYTVTELDHASFIDHGGVYGDLFIGGDYNSGNVVFVDLLTGDYKVVEVISTSYGTFGVGFGKSWWEYDTSTNRMELWTYLSRHLAGDVHRAMRISDGTIVSLESSGGASPRNFIGAPLKLSSTVAYPLTGCGVDNSVNKILWYQGKTKLGETVLTSIVDHPNVVGIAPIGKLTTGEYVSLLHVCDQVSPTITHKFVILTMTSTFAYSSHTEISTKTISLPNYQVMGNVGYPAGPGEITQVPVMYRNKIYVVESYRDNETNVWEIDISDLSFDELNTVLWCVESFKKPTTLSLTVTPL